MSRFYLVQTACWMQDKPNRATLYDQRFDTTKLCRKRPTYGWGVAMVQFSSVIPQFTHIERFAKRLTRFGSVGLLKLIVGIVTRKLGK